MKAMNWISFVQKRITMFGCYAMHSRVQRHYLGNVPFAKCMHIHFGYNNSIWTPFNKSLNHEFVRFSSKWVSFQNIFVTNKYSKCKCTVINPVNHISAEFPIQIAALIFLYGCDSYDCYLIRILKTEPVSSVRPKFNEGDEFTVMRARAQSNVRLLCSAQSSPAPVFRYFTSSHKLMNCN